MFINVCCRISEQRTTSLNSLNSVSPAAKCSGLPPRCVPAVHILGCQQFTDSLQVSAATGLEQLPAALAGPQTNTGLDQLCHHRPGDTAPPPRPGTPEHLRLDNMHGGDRPRLSFRLPVLESLECEQQAAKPQNPAATEATQDDETQNQILGMRKHSGFIDPKHH